MKERVPSIGSMTQTWLLSAFSEPNSSPRMPWSGILGADQRADRLLGLAVGLRHRIEAAFQLVGDVAGRRKRGSVSAAAAAREAPQEFGRNLQDTAPSAVSLLPKCNVSCAFRNQFST